MVIATVTNKRIKPSLPLLTFIAIIHQLELYTPAMYKAEKHPC